MDASDLGPVDPTLRPAAIHERRPGTFTLMDRGWLPPVEQVTQSYGRYFPADGRVVLIADPHVGWSLPGGTVEPGEKLIETLVHEVAEKRVCADDRVGAPRLPSRSRNVTADSWRARSRRYEAG